MLNKYYYNRVANHNSIRTGSIALALIALFLPACAYNQGAVSEVEDNATVEEVTNNTNELIGQTVTVRSEVEKIVGAQAFTIDDEQLFSGEEILVVNASGVPFRVPTDGTELQVTGEVREFDITTIAREFNLDFDPNTYLEYEDKPVIIAKSFALAPKPGEITRNPGKFYNQVIAVEAEVEKTFGPITFTLDEDRLIGGSDLLVLKPLSSPTSVEENEKVVVIGVLRPFVVSELDREYELTKDLNLQRRLDLEHRNKPVLLAKDIFRVE